MARIRKHELLSVVCDETGETVVLALNIGVKGPTRCLSAKTPVRVAEGVYVYPCLHRAACVLRAKGVHLNGCFSCSLLQGLDLLWVRALNFKKSVYLLLISKSTPCSCVR